MKMNIAYRNMLMTRFSSLTAQEESMREAFKTLDDFAKMCGLKVNIDKTNAVWVGSKRNSQEILCEDLKVK
jgi:hypothetical protein